MYIPLNEAYTTFIEYVLLQTLIFCDIYLLGKGG